MITAPEAMTDIATMLAISQNPERVSNILRSSTPTMRVIGMGRTSGALVAVTRSMVVAVMPLLLLVVCRR